ncbi:MAG: hypothetical protein ACP5LQ_05850 [Candidatus Methanodesulfokora sp.]
MRALLRTTWIQPSSTAFRFEVVISSKRDKKVLEPLFPEEKLELGRTYEYHSRVELFPFYVLEALLHFGARAELHETIFRHSPIETTIDGFDVSGWAYNTHMVVLDMNGKCPLSCPWCYASPKKSLGFKLDVDSFQKALIRVLRRILRECKLRKCSFVDVTLAVGGSGDPSSIELSDMEKLLRSIGGTIEELKHKKLFLNIAFSTSDPGFVNNDFLRTILDSSPVPPYSTEVSVSYKTLSERSLIPALKEEQEYQKLVSEALKKVIRAGFHASMQLMLRKKMAIEEVDEAADIAYKVIQPLDFEDWEKFKIFLLRYYSVPWFKDFKPPSRNEAVRLTLEIARSSHAGLLTFDTCLASQLFERPLYEVERNRLWRVNLENGSASRIDGCPRGGICQVSKLSSQRTSSKENH